MYKKIKNGKGFSLIEIILVLGVVSIFMVSIYFIYKKIDTSIKTKREYEKIIALHSETVSFIKAFGWSSLNKVEDLLPKKTLINQFGGKISISNSNYGFKIITRKIPPDVCIQLVMKLNPSVMAITVINDKGFMAVSNNTGNKSWKFDLSKMSIACVGKGTGSNDIWFEFPV